MATEGANPPPGGRTSVVFWEASDRAVFKRLACCLKVLASWVSAVHSSLRSGGGGGGGSS